MKDYDYFYPYFAQERPVEPVIRQLCEEDVSPEWEMDATAVFLTEAENILVVHVSGCSCFPDYGSTEQHLFRQGEKTELFKALTPYLADRMQQLIYEDRLRRRFPGGTKTLDK